MALGRASSPHSRAPHAGCVESDHVAHPRTSGDRAGASDPRRSRGSHRDRGPRIRHPMGSGRNSGRMRFGGNRGRTSQERRGEAFPRQAGERNRRAPARSDENSSTACLEPQQLHPAGPASRDGRSGCATRTRRGHRHHANHFRHGVPDVQTTGTAMKSGAVEFLTNRSTTGSCSMRSAARWSDQVARDQRPQRCKIATPGCPPASARSWPSLSPSDSTNNRGRPRHEPDYGEAIASA
jgi:hypothetical protein